MSECGERVHGTGQRENTRINVSRYSASGTIQSKGMGDRSTDMCVVVPSMRLEGTAASSTQRKRRKLVTSAEGGGSTHSWTGALTGIVTALGAGLPFLLVFVN